jgi:hypothetical protein
MSRLVLRSFVLVLVALVLPSLAVPGCAYPRRSTALSPVQAASGGPGQPSDVWSMRIVSAQIQPRNRGDSNWDDGGGLPDPFVRVYRDDVLVFESRTVDDSIAPVWNQDLPRNISMSSRASLRIEVWDRDDVGGDPVGIYRGHGLPGNALPGVDARILLEGESYVTIRLDDPNAHRGVGITSFEVRGNELLVIEVEAHSPAGRAGIVVGDRIVTIGGRSVSELGSSQATGALSMAGERHQVLGVMDATGDEREVELDHGYVWLTM